MTTVSLTPMERALLQSVDRLQADAATREQRLTTRIDDLTAQVTALGKALDALQQLLAQE